MFTYFIISFILHKVNSQMFIILLKKRQISNCKGNIKFILLDHDGILIFVTALMSLKRSLEIQ